MRYLFERLKELKQMGVPLTVDIEDADGGKQRQAAHEVQQRPAHDELNKKLEVNLSWYLVNSCPDYVYHIGTSDRQFESLTSFSNLSFRSSKRSKSRQPEALLWSSSWQTFAKKLVECRCGS
jgi:hypothetical protein